MAHAPTNQTANSMVRSPAICFPDEDSARAGLIRTSGIDGEALAAHCGSVNSHAGGATITCPLAARIVVGISRVDRNRHGRI